MLTFKEYIEGALAPDRAPRPWPPRVNATPFANARRKRIAGTKAMRVDWFRPTVREVVPRHPIPRLD